MVVAARGQSASEEKRTRRLGLGMSANGPKLTFRTPRSKVRSRGWSGLRLGKQAMSACDPIADISITTNGLRIRCENPSSRSGRKILSRDCQYLGSARYRYEVPAVRDFVP